jgi:hypothetical protein
MIKFVVAGNGAGSVKRAVDLHLDPDEPGAGASTNAHQGLLEDDATYLGAQNETCQSPLPSDASIYNKLFCCVQEFFRLDTKDTSPPAAPYDDSIGNAHVWRPRQACGCPDELKDWTAVNGAASCTDPS